MDAASYYDALYYYGLTHNAPAFEEFDTNMEAYFYVLGAFRALRIVGGEVSATAVKHPSEFAS